jgi:hypothetical protein
MKLNKRLGLDSRARVNAGHAKDGTTGAALRRRRKSRITNLCVALVLGGVGAAFTVLSGTSASASLMGAHPSVVHPTGIWHPAHEVAVSLNTYGHAQTTAVSCGSPGNCSAVGSYESLQSGGLLIFVVNEVDGTWKAAETVPIPVDAAFFFNAISCPSAGNCTAVGYNENIAAFVLDETNGTWGKPQDIDATSSFSAQPTLEAVSCKRAGDCVAGGTLASGQAFLLTETDGTWGAPQVVPGSLNFDAAITSISCPSIGNCAAGGNYGPRPYGGPLPGVGYPFVVNETDGTWGSATRLKGPFDYVDSDDAVDTVTSISCSSPGNCVAGGYYGAFDGFQQAFVVSETDGTWGSAQEVAGSLDVGNRGYLQSVSCPTNGDCAVAGTYLDRETDWQAFVVDDVDGKWQPAQEVAGALNVSGHAWLSSVSCASAGNCSAAGYYANAADGFVGLVVTESDGTWGSGQAVATSDIDDGLAQVNSISCPAVGSCAAGGVIEDDHNYNHLDWQQAFVVDETPITVPSAPTKVAAVAGRASATVKWTAPSSDGGASITSYTVTSSSVKKTCKATTSTSCTVTGLTNGIRYSFGVVATNAAGNSVPGVSNSVIPKGPPGAPTITKITAGTTSVTVTWKAPASDDGSAITGYFVYFGTTSGKESTSSVALSAATRSYTLKGLKKSTRYYVIVRAKNALGLGAKSNQVSAVA